MIRSALFALLVLLILAGSARSGEEKTDTRDLARTLLTTDDLALQALSLKLKKLPDHLHLAVLNSIRSEYRALAESRGGGTALAVAGTYDVDRGAMEESYYALVRESYLGMEKPAPPTDARLAELERAARRTARVMTDSRFELGSPTHLVLRVDGTFLMAETKWRSDRTRRGKWKLDDQFLKFDTVRIGERVVKPGNPWRYFKIRLLRWGTLEFNREKFTAARTETWLLVRK